MLASVLVCVFVQVFCFGSGQLFEGFCWSRTVVFQLFDQRLRCSVCEGFGVLRSSVLLFGLFGEEAVDLAEVSFSLGRQIDLESDLPVFRLRRRLRLCSWLVGVGRSSRSEGIPELDLLAVFAGGGLKLFV